MTAIDQTYHRPPDFGPDAPAAQSIDGATLQNGIPEMRLVRESSVPVAGFDSKPLLDSPEACARFLAPFAAREYAETLWLLPLDSAGRLTTAGPVVISRGSVDSTSAHSREIFRAAIVANAVRIVLAHNHPNGNLTPSQPDYVVTRRTEEAARIIGIPLEASLILTPDGLHCEFRSSDQHRNNGFFGPMFDQIGFGPRFDRGVPFPLPPR